MKDIRYDFHIHTALSPCAMDDMTPNNIIGMASLCEVDMIAITDHNSCDNVEAVIKVAKNSNIVVIPGMEIETKEEIHTICLFTNINDVYNMQKIVTLNSSNMVNKSSLFGKQYIIDENDEIVSQNSRLLSIATKLSLSETANYVNEFGGILIPAHIDRPSYSIISNLGFIPENLKINSIEISKYADYELLKNKYRDYNILQCSDAHELGHIYQCEQSILLQEKSIECLFEFLKD